ncbi:ARF/SAR superfamily [Gonapodya prolifera JEL478]|uniref:ARF/SAR superfamily n=1 Tax=Gonapodya prolifera (strain JEL478) TaxID=1344416 RepID=A0A139AW86_GONPJ|nr:ARF/SAR superfamily [Gonapodya prolifera JEL478]|eukprot:KXS20969.1 ARF/SAR superfamily [Gonapodya prolifera JEL478]
MYTLLSGLYKHVTQKEEFYILILGLDNAGKTTLLEKIKTLFTGTPGMPPEKIAPTVGLNIAKIPITSTARLNFWDLGGQREMRSLWPQYYDECHGIVFVIDSCDEERLDECRAAADSLLTSDLTLNVPLILLANKQDLPTALPPHELKERFVNRIAERMGARESGVMAVSAIEGTGVKDAIDWIWTRVQRNRSARPPMYR